VTSGARVLDIGAHIGYYTLLSSKLVGPEGKVYAFEPNPENGVLLAKSIEANSLHNVELIRKAVGREAGKANLYLSGVSNENQCYYVEGRKHVEVEITSLDDFFRDLPGVDFMKIDVDGFEINILHGAEKLIQKSKGLMMVTEFSPHHLTTAGEDPREYFNYLTRLGFKMSLIDERTGAVRPVAVDELLKEMNTSYNLFCVKS
jgi:FkbM family methyltransferase